MKKIIRTQKQLEDLACLPAKEKAQITSIIASCDYIEPVFFEGLTALKEIKIKDKTKLKIFWFESDIPQHVFCAWLKSDYCPRLEKIETKEFKGLIKL